MEFIINQIKRGVYELSNDVNKIEVQYSSGCRYDNNDKKFHPGWCFKFNQQQHIYPDKESAFNAAFKILRNYNVFDIEGFIKHLDNKDDDLDSRYVQTIRNIVEYGLRHECLVEDQFVDWLTMMISNAELYDVILFTNNIWLSKKYQQIKDNMYFVMKEWVLSSEIWPEEKGHIDLGHKVGLYRGYRIEVQNDFETFWMNIDFVGDETLTECFNDDYHLRIYKENGYRPTGRISFIGYFKMVDPTPEFPKHSFQRID